MINNWYPFAKVKTWRQYHVHTSKKLDPPPHLHNRGTGIPHNFLTHIQVLVQYSHMVWTSFSPEGNPILLLHWPHTQCLVRQAGCQRHQQRIHYWQPNTPPDPSFPATSVAGMMYMASLTPRCHIHHCQRAIRREQTEDYHSYSWEPAEYQK